MNTCGECVKSPSTPDPDRLRPEHIWLGLAVAALPVALATYAIDATTSVDMGHGSYEIVLALAVLGACGWLVGAAERRVRQAGAAREARTAARLADVSDQCEQMRWMLASIAGTLSRPKPGGHLYVSGAAQGETVGIARASVDPIQVAREEGIEQGFDIGVRTTMAERGVVPLQRRRRP